VVKRRLRLVALTTTLGTAAVAAGAAHAGGGGKPPEGVLTHAPPMIAPVAKGVSVQPIMTVGETLASGYRFESIPDGISIERTGKRTADLYVNHETSLVPFPVKSSTVPTTLHDYTNAMLSKLSINTKTAGVLGGSYVIPSSANYQRFCSNFLVGKEHGFDRKLIFTNEEATDFVFRTGVAWPAPMSEPPAEQAGVVVAYDVKSGEFRSIYGMGRHNHENSVGIPGYGHPVVLSGDDTFSAPSSQLYLYSAEDADEVWADEGTLYAFVSDVPTVNDYGDLTVSGSVSGKFIEVPEAIAKGPQGPLETWSNDNNVFQFIRLEDIAYDRKDPRIVYIADTGEPRALPGDPRLTRGPSGTMGPYPNGRIFKFVLDKNDPLTVESLSILINGDSFPAGSLDSLHQPDNLETTRRSLLIQEDPGSHNQYSPPLAAGKTTARIWNYDLKTGKLEVVARVDQAADPAASLGSWESSGIVDAHSTLGKNWFFVDVQAPSLSLDRQIVTPDGDDPDDLPEAIVEREGGQLLAIKIPGTHGSGDHDDDD
jgi:hypothetical protein